MATPLDAALVRGMGIAHIEEPAQPAPDTDQRCTGLAFSDTGDFLVSVHRDGTINVFDGNTGARAATYFARDTGCKLVAFTHSPNAILHASDRGGAGSVSYHDVHQNKVVRTFRGHAGPITSLSMSPINDTFLTTSTDGAFKLWDLRQSQPIGGGAIPMPTRAEFSPNPEAPYPTANFDGTGRIFAVVSPQRGLAMFDAGCGGAEWSTSVQRALFGYTVMPVRVPTLPADAPVPPPYPALISYTGLEFSPDDKTAGPTPEGKLLAIGTVDRGVLLVDAFSPAKEFAQLAVHPSDPAHPSSMAWSPDGRWLTVGGVDGHVYCYDCVTGKPPTLPGDAVGGFAWRPGVWDPQSVVLGESHKSEAARTAAGAAASAFKKKTWELMFETRAKFAAQKGITVEQLGPPRTVPSQPPPFAATAEEQVSRHEMPVTFVKWHPRAAVLATAARNVAIWTPPAS